MGYTHYWYRPQELAPDKFQSIVRDFSSLLPKFARIHAPLASPNGYGQPLLNMHMIMFNGVASCGHPSHGSFHTAWPMPNATAIKLNPYKAFAGYWGDGVLLKHRCCDGNCSHESCVFPRVWPNDRGRPDEDGFYGDCCKTAFKPYDVAVTTLLVIAKHHLGADFRVGSDGTLHHFQDAIRLCNRYLGYGAGFKLGRN